MQEFNINKYKELKKKVELLTNKSENLSSEQDYIELTELEQNIQDQIFLNNKIQYFTLITNYLNDIIIPSEFRIQFIEMMYQDIKKGFDILEDFEKLANFSIDKKENEVANSLEEIYEYCLGISEIESEGEVISEEKFREFIIQKFKRCR